jgi:hypothetical protein
MLWRSITPDENKNPEIAKPSRDCYDGRRMTESDTREPRQSPVRLHYKILAYIATWTAALLLTAPGMRPLVYMFPLGLVPVIDRHLANDGGRRVLIGCYVVYIVHAFFFFRSKTTLRTAILYGVLVILLIGNVAGCREMIHSH